MGFLGKNKKDPAATQDKLTTRDRGNAAEDRALAHLLAARLKLVERNYRTPGRGGGEIDLVMRAADGTLIFVEVRQRSTAAFGGAGGSIGHVKQHRIVFAARHYLMRWSQPPACRFDVVLVEPERLTWLQGAFDAD